MRSGAFRRGLGLLFVLVALGGCASETKQQYLKHLSTTIAPVEAGNETAPSTSSVAANTVRNARP